MSGIHPKFGGFGPQPGGYGGPGGPNGKGGSGEKSKFDEKAAAKAAGIPYGQYKKQFEDGFEGMKQQWEAQMEAAKQQWEQRSGGGMFGFPSQDFLSYYSSTPQAVNGQKAYSTQPPVDLGSYGSVSANAKSLPFVSQYSPVGADANYKNGDQNCGPAVLAMIGKSFGLEPANTTDAKYITDLMAKAGTTAQGTTGNGMIAALADMGMQTAANPGADLNWINTQLAQGHEVIANGDFYSIAEHSDPKLMAGHYIAVTGVNNGLYTIVDPANPNGTSTTMTADQLNAFIANHPEGGFTLAAWPDPTQTAAAVG